MKPKPLLTNEIPQELDILREKLGVAASIPQIKKYYAEIGVYRTNKNCQLLAGLLAKANTEKLNLMLPAIIADLPANPAPRNVRPIAEKHGVVMGRVVVEELIAKLKVEKPELWQNKGRLQALLTPSDTKLLKALATTLNVSEKSVPMICIRALVMANFRGQVNLAEISSISKSMTESDIAMLVNSLNAIIG